ncbi:sorting nexin 2B-like isoform X1 [Silene latifolia]|uniref:sorting nexin 2B-like isoform X1 n=1 Tax=Silene latifolia TaxID=37657 RepID=UPI003D76BEAC
MMDHNHHDSTNDSSEFMDDLTLHDNHQPSSHASDFPEISAIADHLPAKNPNSSLNSFVDPPSYADAMFRSFDADSIAEINGHHRLNSLSFSSSEEPSEFLHISVSDPQKVPESSNSLVPGGSYYYNYLITTRTNLDNFSSTEFSVRRRFSEVVTLSDRLSECYRGYVIPLRPDKSIMESQMMQKTEFVEQRRVAVEKYLKKLAAHPTIRKSEELRVFLEVDGRLGFVNTIDVASRMLDGVVKLPGQLIGETAMAAEEVVQPAKGGRDLFRLFKELKQAVSNDWSGVKPSVVEEDKEFLEKKVRLNELEQQLSNVSEQAETLVKAQQDIGETMGELGLAFVKLTKFELDEVIYECQRARAADMKNMATASVKASRLYRELNAQTVKHLDKLHDYLGMMLAVDNAFTERSNALLTVQTLATELSSLQSRIEKLEIAASKIFGGDRSRMRKIEELKETMKVTEDAKLCAVKEYERIKENNKNELDRIEKERHSDFLSMLKGFVVNQTATFLLNLQTGICDHLMVKCNHNGTTTVAAYGNLFFNSGHIWL